MKFVFIVQGEGRGHQTQALALSEMLTSNGHEISLALVGTNNPFKIPSLLAEKASFKIETFQSPSLIYNSKTQALSLNMTIRSAVPNTRKYIKSILQIKRAIEICRPDVIINFYDFLGGLYSAFFTSKAKVICIGHQYLLLNRHFNHPKGHWLDRQIVNFNTRITALGSDKILALSFSEFENDREIITVPPLVRNELIYYSNQDLGYILVYLTQPEMISEFLIYAGYYTHLIFEVFIDKCLAEIPENVRINPISSSAFIQKMAKCKAIISTAGFESVCEAMYLGKPALMVPIKKHYEQLCNALDAQRAGAGIFSKQIDIGSFLTYLQTSEPMSHKIWIHQAEQMFMSELSDEMCIEI